MAEGVTPKPMGDLATAFLVAMIAGAVALGWLNSRDWLGRKIGSSGGGSIGDDGAAHHHGGWSDHADQGGDHGVDAGGGAGH